MTKTATVHAQQMWEYHAINRKTEEFLITDLNELGKAGWELVNATYNKDVKGVAASFSWTAILKRPAVPQAAPTTASAVETTPAPSPPAPSPPTPPAAPSDSDSETEVFEMRG